ncbi:hypothetical protein EYC84_009884 [Monilinia fructicola]|uniref:TATA element modulatory factor 1 TATA binding domain-containing protein n=1 Tax=Monilinia fructicola TaxID=38448 RepID=A0A5M9JBR4_MONFR|nr:hypothetical protein EYC84_009884 [Monilinia fructicola]
MTSPAKQTSSRWGSFLSQAVGGLESRLDNILAEGQEGPVNRQPSTTGTAVAAKPEAAVSRSGSNSSRTNDRLQERLARAVAAKNAQKSGTQSTSSNVFPRETGSPITVGESPRQSLDATSSVGGDEATKPISQDLEGSFDSVPPPDPISRSSADEPPILPTVSPPDATGSSKTPAELEAALSQLQSDYETSELQRQEEQRKVLNLQVLRKNAAPPGSLEKKLAEKEEQVVLLMEEGQALSKKELTHMTAIKNLRAKVIEGNKEIAEAKKKQEKAEKEAASLAERLKRAEGAEKSLKAEARVAHEALEAEKKRVAELEDDVSNLKIEKQLVNDRAQIQIKELREKMDKESESARIAALEMKNEQQMLESKLEVMRARAEEVSSGATGDAQAKLLRQVETLQTQMLLQKRRGMRQPSEKLRLGERLVKWLNVMKNELEETRSKLPNFEQELSERTAQLDDLKKRTEEAEAALVSAKAEFEDEKQTWNSEMQQRILEEKQKWLEEISFGSRGESPVATSRRGFNIRIFGSTKYAIEKDFSSIHDW